MDRPNFWSSVPVRTFAWPPADDAGHHPHHDLLPAAGGTERGQPGDLRRAVDDDPSDTEPQRRSRRSSGLLALPCSTIRSGGKPVVTASSSSPAEQTSRPRPSSWTQWTIARHRNALAA